MNLLHALAAGIRGAENGVAELYVRGTTNRAVRYLDFEATQPITPTDALSLDANGAAVVYVNQLVDVVVWDSLGNQRVAFTAGDSASAIEVISQSFTGTDYVSGQRAASKPTTLQAALDLVKTSFGALDFNVLFNGSSSTLQAAFVGLSNIVYNVKTYGAVGDGAADDTSAIQAAVTAAHTAGGGIVFFPGGTYRYSAAINIDTDVNLVGAGAGATTLQRDHATASGIRWITATAGEKSRIEGIRFSLAQNSNADHIRVNLANVGVVVVDCAFDAGTSDLTGSHISVLGPLAGTQVSIVRSRFLMSAGTTYGVQVYSGPVVALDCDFVGVTTLAGPSLISVSGTGGAVALCRFDMTGVGGGSVVHGIRTAVGMAGNPAIVGNQVTAGGGGSVRMDLNDCIEFGNSWGSDATVIQSAVAPTNTLNQSLFLSVERSVRRAAINGAVAAYTMPDDAGDFIVDYNSTAPAFSLTGPSAVVGKRIRVMYDNKTGSPVDVQLIAGSGYTNAGGGAGIVSVGSHFCYAVIGQFVQTRTGMRLVLEQANSGSQFAD